MARMAWAPHCLHLARWGTSSSQIMMTRTSLRYCDCQMMSKMASLRVPGRSNSVTMRLRVSSMWIFRISSVVAAVKTMMSARLNRFSPRITIEIRSFENNTFCMISFDRVCLYLLPLPRIKRITDAFTEQIVAEHGDQNCETGEGRKPPGDLDVVLTGGKQAAPAWGRGLNAEAEKTQGRLDEDRTADAHGGGDEDRREAIGQNVLHDDAAVGGADCVRGDHEVALFERDELRADEPGRLHPTGEPDHDHNI